MAVAENGTKRTRGRRTDVISDETKAEFRRAARRLLSEHGYSGTTTRMIATEVGVTSATLHHHFGSKLELALTVWRATMDDEHQRLDAAVDAATTWSAKVRALLEATYQSTRRDPEASRFIAAMREEARRTPELHEVMNDARTADLVRRIVDFGVESGEIEPDHAPAARGAISAVSMGATLLAIDLTPHRVAAVFDGCMRLFEGTLQSG